MNLTEKIILFSRFPRPGEAKTRLIPALGPAGAADLQKKMSEQAAAIAARAADSRGAQLEIRFTGCTEQEMRQWLTVNAEYADQGSGDLGRRMGTATACAFEQGYRRLIIIGADCPALTEKHLGRALDMLAEKDLVIGPSLDGGYYLIGLSRQAPELFYEIPWGGPGVAEATIARAAALNLATSFLDKLHDIDSPEDLDHIADYPLP